MAEFKLGRIRFVWKGDWSSDSVYYQDDVVSFGGKIYICVLGHTSQTGFFSDFDIVPPKWNIVSDGQTWRGEWDTDTEYVYDDIVSYGARLYICNTIHTSAADANDGLELDQDKWNIFAEGLDWKGNWAVSTRYRINDIVKYGASVYVCNTLHTSAADESSGLEANQSSWDLFNRGLEYKSEWTTSTKYKVNDLVRYGANVWICTIPHASGFSFTGDISNWEKFVEGFQYENDWNPFVGYQPGDIVRYGGNQYISKTNNTDSNPPSSVDDWDTFSEGFTFIGEWNEDSAAQEYKVGEVVRLGGYIYVCTQDHSNQTPPNADYWNLLNTGFRWTGEWRDDAQYYLGDVVRYDSNSYVCILDHISEGDDYSSVGVDPEGGGNEGSRPDLADSGQYWSVLAIGSEQSVLNTPGDMVYFSGSAPTRLPIGQDGQVLKVGENDTPTWEFLASIDDIYYVADKGFDGEYPVNGSNIDRPFKTIKFACEEIEKGIKFQNSKFLLERNRVWMQREVSSYVRDQVDNALPGSIWYQLDYDTVKCERDTGFIIDRTLYDLSHGGNLKTRAAAQTYLNVLSDGPYSTADENNGTGTYTRLAEEAEADAAAFEYLLTLMGNVLSNTVPDTIYQNVTDDSTAIVDQYFNENLILEDGALDRLTSLVGIVTTALETQDDSTIPEREIVHSLVKVSTGKHYEVLPIIVPAYTAIQGDELRSTHVIAGLPTVTKTDSKYKLPAFDRLANITSNIVLGSTVTPTLGNVEVQDQDWPYAITDQSSTVESLSLSMKYQSEYLLNELYSGKITDPNNLSLGDYYARENIKANINFIVEEVIAYLDDEYPTLKYGKTDTRRDTTYIIDSLIYDLTYGGNSLAVVTGLAYWDGDDDTIDQLPASLKTETIAAINYLKTTAQSVAGNTSVVSPKQSVVTQTLTGNVGSITEIANNVEDIIDIIQNGPDAVGDTTTLVNPTLADGVNSTTALIAAKSALDAATAGIKTDTTSWITANYPNLVYNSAKCERDVGKILEAVGFDFALNSNHRTLKAAHAYLRKTAVEVYTGGQKQQTREAIQYALLDATDGAIANVASDATAIARITESARIIDAVLFGATNEGSVCQTNDQNAYYAMLQLERNRDFIVSEITSFVNYNYSNFSNYISQNVTEERIGRIVDAVSYDLITGSNYPSIVIARELKAENFDMQMIALAKEVQTLVIEQADASLHATLRSSFTTIINILERGISATPTLSFADNGTSTADDSTTAGTFQTNKATLVSAASTYYQTNYSALWAAKTVQEQTDWETNIGYIIDAATFDILYGGNYQSVLSGELYYDLTSLILTTAEQTAEIDTLTNSLKVELISDAEAASQTSVGNNIDDVIDILTNGSGSVAVVYPSEAGETATIQSTYTAIQAADTSIQTSAYGYLINEFSSFTYDVTTFEKDINNQIDAIKYDLMYPGNYKTRYVSRFYTNEIIGSQEEDMFYLRDATGVRNCTLKGLNGDLTPENTYGTSRTTAGAYCSLDPGFGPDDFTTWIITRSPYIQGVTTFGNAAVGQRIDGALHNGGNDSMVSNDFTQVISDGIGAHILNNGRAELVSVFTYYSHIGYLAETGGRIRATNGNNSYGDFGSVAEGVDPEETPINAIVDNKTQYNATISNVFVADNALQVIEYGHAGDEYTEAKIDIFGPGADEVLIVDEFRDNALNYVQVDQDADPDIPIGGDGYVIISNVAQAGTLTEVTLSATDGNLSSSYPGMKVYIIGGAGVGQYAIVDTYNSGSKIATVTKESDGTAGWDHIVPGTPIVAPNSSSTYQIEPRITITAPTNSDAAITMPTSTTWYDAEYIQTSAQYTGVSATGGDGSGATFDVTRNGSKYYLTVNAAGTGYSRLDELTIAGTDVGGASTTNDITITLTSLNSTTGAVVDFDFTGLGQKGKFLAVGAGTNGAVSVDGATWTAETLPALPGGNWASIADGLADDGSSTFKQSTVIIVADGNDTVAYSNDADTWLTSNLPGSFNATGENTVAFGQIDDVTARFVVISDADQDVAYSNNGGVTWSVAGTALPATGYGEMVYGAGKFVAINSGTTSAAYSADGINWTGVTAPAAFAAVTDIVWGNGKFVALGGTNGIMYSLDGVTWVENDLTLPLTATERKLAYGQGTFVITSDDTNEVQYSHDGLYWQAYTLSTTVTGGYNAIAFGNPAQEGKFAILPNAAGTSGNVAKINTPAKGRASVANEKVFEVRITEPGSGYTTAPTATVIDPNNTQDVVLVTNLGNGAIANPTFVNRGTGFTDASAELNVTASNGFANFPQNGNFIAVKRITERPVNGSNIEFASLPGQFFKLVNTVSFIGTNDGSYTGFLQISPNIPVEDSLPDGDAVEGRIRFSQVRLTGHDFLDIGTGSFANTNYPNTPLTAPDQLKETIESNGGRVFYTSTDQDGNFRVGDLFTIEQSTGVATLNADAFNIAGLQELSLGEVTLGGNSATVNEFSTDPFFTANSDNVVPTQRAVKAYIEAQIGGGGATLNVNSVTAGDIFIGADTITSLSGDPINIRATVIFSGNVLGLPLAYNYFLR